MKFADGQLLYKGWPHARGNHEQPVGLAVVGRQLCKELIVGHPGRGGQTRLQADACPDFFRDRSRRASIHQRRGHIEIGLVQRQRLSDQRVACKDGADLLRHCPIDIKARRYKHKLGALPPGCDRGHCRADTKFARLVTRGSHHTARPRAANSDRNPAERRIVALFHGRVESVHIDVDDAVESQCQVGRVRHAAGDDITRQPASQGQCRSRDVGLPTCRPVRAIFSHRTECGDASPQR